MSPEEFIKAYEEALGSQEWNKVSPLISAKACISFSDGSVHNGIDQIKIAFEKNFNAIKSEKYAMENVRWILKKEDHSVYVFEYHWTGIINGKSHSGSGIGSSIIIKENEKWKLVTEHLGRKA